MSKHRDWYRQVEYCRVPLPKQLVPQRHWSWSKVDRIPITLDKATLSIERHWHLLQAVHCTGRNNCSELKHPLSRIDVLFLMRLFRLYPRLKMSFEHNSARKNLFLSSCFCWDSRHSLREMKQNFKFGGTIGYGDLYLEFLFGHFKVFRLHAKLNDAAEAVRANSGKRPGYCYMIGRGPNSYLLGLVINNFPWYGAICSRPCFCEQQEFNYAIQNETETSKISSSTISPVLNLNWFA